jgi:hypothetical protein
MTAADKRIEDLLARWQASLDLHARYAQLDDAAYSCVERWPSHQRPTAWVVELARKRLLELRDQLGRRQAAGDTAFAEALELMSFLTSLLDSEHIERFIPLATGQPVDTGASAVVQPPQLCAKPRPSSGQTGTHRQHGAPKSAAPHKPAAPPRLAATTNPKAAASPSTPRARRDPPQTQPPPSRPPAPGRIAGNSPPDARTRQVIADAVRMLEWGREWPALAGLIARMADRPVEQEVWTILRAHRAEIFTRARRPSA